MVSGSSLSCNEPWNTPYNIERVVLQTQVQFGDKAHIVYVNGAYRGEDAIGELMRDFRCSDYRDMKNKTLANMVQYYKEDPEGVSKMCEAMDRIAEKRAAEAAHNRSVERQSGYTFPKSQSRTNDTPAVQDSSILF